MITIRPERKADIAAIKAVNDLAFGQEEEGLIVEGLREAGALSVSLVAEDDGKIVGHIAFSPVTIEKNPDALILLGLGPMAVAPEFQKRGVGGKLIKRGLEVCKQVAVQAIVVLGHPEYYPRFGFLPSFPYNIAWDIECPKEAFMVLELEQGTLSKISGKVKYDPVFMGG